MLYELLALCHPFEARNQAALVLKIVRGQYEPPAGDYSAGLVRLLDLCLAHAPSRRPHTAELLREPSLRAACERLRIELPTAEELEQQLEQRPRFGEAPLGEAEAEGGG